MTRRPAAPRVLSHLAAAAASVLLPAYAVHATTYSWSSPASGTFTDSSLWSPSGIPNSGDTALIAADTSAHVPYTVSLFPNTPTGALTVNADPAELDLRTVNGDTHTTIDSLDVQKGVLYFTNGNGTGLNHLDLGPAGLTLGQVAEADFGDGNSWQVHGNVTNNGGNLANTLFGGFHLSGYTTFTGIFNNSGAVTTTSPAFVNNFTGTFANLPGGTLTIQPNFHFRITGGTFDFQGGAVTGTVEMYNGATLKTSAASVQGNGAVFKFAQPGYLATHLAPGTVASVPSTLTTTNASTTNFGAIRLENPNGSATLQLDTDGTGFLTNLGSLTVNSYASLQGHLLNRGTTLVNSYLSATSITNGNPADDSGVFYQTLGDTTVSSPAPGVQGQFNQLAGLLHIDPGPYNHLVLDNSIFHYDGGTVEGAVQLRNNSVFTGNAADGHNATFKFTGPGILGRVPEHTTINIDGQSVTAVGQDNFGTIQLMATNGQASHLTATDSVTFPNRGNLDLYSGAYVHGSVYSIGAVHFYGYSTFQDADLQNDYIFEVAPGVQANFVNSTLRHTGGTLTVAANSILKIDHSTLSFEGGSISAPPGTIALWNNSTLKTTVADGGGVSFDLYGDNSLTTDLSPGVTANERDGALSFYDGHTNRGTLDFSGPNGHAPSLAIYRPDSGTNTGTLTNAGTILFHPGSYHYVYGSLINNGTITAASSFNSAGQLLGTSIVEFNNGDVTVNAGSSFTIDPYSTVNFHGQGAGAPNQSSFTLNGGTVSIGKQSHLNMLDGGNFVFLAGTVSLNGATATIKPDPGGIPASSLLQASGQGAALSLATGGNNVFVGGAIIGNDGASLITNDGGSLITNDGGSLITNDGATLITNDGGSIFAANGGSIISGNGSAIVATGGGNIISGNGSAIISGNGSAAPSGVVASATTPPTPISTITLQGGSLSATGGSIIINPDGALVGHGTASAASFQAAGTLSPDDPANPLTINAPATLSSGATLAGPGTLSFTQGLSVTAPVSKSSPGPLSVTGGPLTISPSASLDLATAPLTLDPNTTLPQLRQYLHDARLTSSSADATHRLAYLFSGEPTAPTSLLVTLALTGDANLDGTLNADDYALLDRGFVQHGSYWWQGDFNYDGTIDQNDYLLIDTTYGQAQGFSPGFLSQRESQFGAPYVSALLTSVPEPSSLSSILYLLSSLTLTRRRRAARALRPST